MWSLSKSLLISWGRLFLIKTLLGRSVIFDAKMFFYVWKFCWLVFPFKKFSSWYLVWNLILKLLETLFKKMSLMRSMSSIQGRERVYFFALLYGISLYSLFRDSVSRIYGKIITIKRIWSLGFITWYNHM